MTDKEMEIARLNDVLEAHRRFHKSVGCPGRPECYVCAEEEWALDHATVSQVALAAARTKQQEIKDACEIPNRRRFDDELTCLINKYSKENGSNTPDFILADYLICCLNVLNKFVADREDWHGRPFCPGRIDSSGVVAVTRNPSVISKEIAARVWCDQEMGNCAMDADAADAIAQIIDDVRKKSAP